MKRNQSSNLKSRNNHTSTQSKTNLTETKALTKKTESCVLKKFPLDMKSFGSQAQEHNNSFKLNTYNKPTNGAVTNLKHEEIRRLSKMKDKLKTIFQTDIQVDRGKYLNYFRKGFSESEKKEYFKEYDKLRFSCVQNKKFVDNKLIRGDGEIDLKQRYNGVAQFRQSVFSEHQFLMNKEVMVKMYGKANI